MRKRTIRLLQFMFVILFPLSVLAVEFSEFQTPPDSARPAVYWFIMDGNLTKEGITADFEAMKQQGIGGLILMEVNVGVPRGKVEFMSETWQEHFVHIVRETERLGLQLTLSSGPGWAGSGGPWITPETSMLHLVASEKNVKGPAAFHEALPKPVPRKPFFGEGQLLPEQEKARKEFFKDVRVLAFPTPEGNSRISDINEKALYVRAPYSSAPNTKPRLESLADYPPVPAQNVVLPSKIIDITDRLEAGASGVLKWDVPQGNWTILRFAATSTGANTRPAPIPGFGLESSKMDRDAFDIHYKNYIEKLLTAVGERQTDGKAGWTSLHIDSWEMGSQNYSKILFDEFRKRRGYDPIPFLPAYSGYIVDNTEKTERFLWDLRQTAQEVIIQNHGEYLRELAHKHKMTLSLEPYDMMPCCDMTFGALADVPMCEFWSPGGFNTMFCCLEAASVAHLHGKPVVAAEAFTSGRDNWRQNPKSMKLQGDWAFCTGINRITFHRYQHQPYLDRYPGFSMGGYGIHWERTQTWWNLVADYHRYLARCQHLLQQGKAVADVLYLLPEGSPQVFTPPASALTGSGNIQDQRGYRFDACDPDTLIKYALVENGRISFASKQGNTFWVGGINRELPVTFGKKNPNATEYRLLVLPNVETMTPDLSWKIEQLVHMGATVVGLPPKKSPSLQKYFDLSRPTLAQHRPTADEEVRMVAGMLWGTTTPTAKSETRVYHQGKIITLPRENVTGVPLRMAGAKWIWFPEGNPAHDAPSGTRFFRKTFSLPEGAKIDDARFLATADNDLTVKINGKEVYKTSYPSPLKIVSFAEILKSGENVIELEAVNSPSDLRNPAGLIANFVVRTIDKNGETALIQMTTDATWNSSQDGKDWRQAAKVLGDFGMSPWSVAEYSGAAAGGAGAELYPDYQFTAKILAAEGLAEDFVSPNESLRFFHRQDGETEIYFVANKKNEPFQADVSFRVTGKKASIWNPQTGKKFRTPPTTENKSKGQTTLNLFLEGSESVFVIFDQHGADASLPVWQKTELPRTVLELDKDWTVFFEPKRGAPEKAEFAQLTDLSKHPEDGIKYFSGIATYQKTFNIKKQNNQPLFLDLGNVEVMARVHLNGKLVGTCWIAPYRLEITDDVKDGENELRVEVANLWANRLIGDAALPADKRVTWSTWNGGYKADSKLMPSSLIGPVKILSPLP